MIRLILLVNDDSLSLAWPLTSLSLFFRKWLPSYDREMAPGVPTNSLIAYMPLTYFGWEGASRGRDLWADCPPGPGNQGNQLGQG